MIDFLIGWMVGNVTGFFVVVGLWLAVGRIRNKFRKR